MDNKRIKKNILFAFLSQFISLFLSILMSLIVPKLLGVTSFGYWQLFIFYCSYAALSTFGLTDGLYLKYGGSDYDKLDHSLIKSQWVISTIIQIFIAFIIIMICIFTKIETNRLFVIIFALAYMLIHNVISFIGYLFQAVNQTNKYSKSIIIDRIVFIVAVIYALTTKIDYFQYYIILYIIAQIISLIYCIYSGRKVFLSKVSITKNTFKELLDNFKIGSNLMIANIASNLILGIGRMFIDAQWGIETFGKLSFSLSLMSFIIQFLAQFGMVFFPALRTIKLDEQKKFFIQIRNYLFIILPFILVLYVPIKFILSLWLPQYADSLYYLGILFPLIIFDGKMQILFNTYLKVLRKEKFILIINIITALFSLILCFFSAVVIKNVIFVIISMIVSLIFRSILSELYLSKKLNFKQFNMIFYEIIFIIIYILLFIYVSDVYLLIFAVCSYIVLALKNYNVFKEVINIFKRILKGGLNEKGN